MPEPRKPGDYTGIPTTGRTRLLGDGGKPIAPDAAQERASEPPAQPQAPAASTPAAGNLGAAFGSPDWESRDGVLYHVAPCVGRIYPRPATGRRACDGCGGEWWRPDKLKRRWERV